MKTGVLSVVFMLWFVSSLSAQTADSLKSVELEEVIIRESYQKRKMLSTPINVEVAEKDFLERYFTGNLMQTLEHIPGVRSMDIGSGFSKPMIRGMAFNRIVVSENGIKQEGQQWGADHGLEIDAFNVERIVIRKGPSALVYGSDAMGGAVEILPFLAPTDDTFFGEVNLLGKSVNRNIGGSLLLGFKRKGWYTKVRYSEQHYGDYKVPTDTVVYLTQKLPIYNQRLKNTAGYERNINFYTEYRKGNYSSNYAASNVFQKGGFFPGAHGIPDASRLESDGNSQNIELPYNTVNHFKVSTHQQYFLNDWIASWDLGFQNNRRQEWSQFHTHYGTQTPPEKEPDKELGFYLNTYSSLVKLKWLPGMNWEHTMGWDLQYQQNDIDGYSFLLPEYKRFTSGWMWVSTYRLSEKWNFSGGLRFDYGKVDISSYKDEYLEEYLHKQGYEESVIEAYRWRSYAVNRSFGDWSASLGAVWTPRDSHILKGNIGRSFRLPGANELASNGVHHGTFRHEQGNTPLASERGWQVDLSYMYEKKNIQFSVSPFANGYRNYIYLKPTGEWSILPHAGQIYRYTGAKVVFMGSEISFSVDFLKNLNYSFSGEYVYTYNRDENIPLSFSPPASMYNTLSWKNDFLRFSVEVQSIAAQKRVARNEDITLGTNLLHLRLNGTLPFWNNNTEVLLSAHNLLNTKYYNHLSFYRKVEIPEPGRNFQLSIKVSF